MWFTLKIICIVGEDTGSGKAYGFKMDKGEGKRQR